MKILLVLLFLVSCGQNNDSGYTKVYRVDPAIQPYIDRFEADAFARGKTIGITALIAEFKDLKDLGSDKIGVCYSPGGDGTPIIHIDPEYWENGTKNNNITSIKNNPELLDAAREYLIFHELGHCISGYPHRDGPNGPDARNPTSIMNTYALSPYFYLGLNTTKTPSPNCKPSDNKECLLAELFYPNFYNFQSILMASTEPTEYATREELNINLLSSTENEQSLDSIFIYEAADFEKIESGAHYPNKDSLSID